MLIPAMEREGYTRRFAAAVTAASSVIGPIIPPSIIMIVYAYVMQVSVAGLFLAGFVPGLLTGLGLMVATFLIARRRDYPKTAGMATPLEMATAFWGALLPLLTPVIIIGGILSGIFTPTEAAGAAVLYALLLSLFGLRTLALRDLPPILLRAGVAASAILLVVGTATVFGWVATLSGVPDQAVRDPVLDLRQPAGAAVPDQHPTAGGRHVPGCRPGDPDSSGRSWARPCSSSASTRCTLRSSCAST